VRRKTGEVFPAGNSHNATDPMHFALMHSALQPSTMREMEHLKLISRCEISPQILADNNGNVKIRICNIFFIFLASGTIYSILNTLI